MGEAVKARDVKVGDTVMCCATRAYDHLPRPVVVTRINTASGTKRIAFAYEDDRRGKGPGVTVSYRPDETVVLPA